MSQAAPPPAVVTASDLSGAVAAAQEELAQGVQRGDLSRDPYRFVLGALSVTVGLFPQLVERMERAAEGARVPMSAEEKAAFRRDVREGLRVEAGKLASATSRRTALIAGAVMALTAVVSGLGGYLLGRSAESAELRAASATIYPALMDGSASARVWADAIRRNDLPGLMARCTGAAVRMDPSGRQVCSVPLWLDDGRPTPAATGGR